MTLERWTLFWRKQIGGTEDQGDKGVGSPAKTAGRKVNRTGEGGEVGATETEGGGLAGGVGRRIDEVVSIIWGG